MNVNKSSWTIQVIGEHAYTPESTDNTNKYDHIYGAQPGTKPTARHGVFVFKGGKKVASALMLGYEGGTGISGKSFYLDDTQIWLCASNNLFCLGIPTLVLHWQEQIDQITNFGIHPFEDDFIIHGEMSISRVSKEGKPAWQFSGKDIFVTSDDTEEFQVKGKTIEVIDFSGNKYSLDKNGNLLT